jgi:glycosyltransferase involved in cell wall biosynthesis
MRKPNILQLIGSFEQGGSERQAVQLCRLLHESGRYRIHVACLDPKGVLRHEIEAMIADPIPAFPLTSFYDRNALKQIVRFAKYLRAHRIDAVQTHDFYTNIFGMVGAALAGTPVRIAARRESAKRPQNHRRIERCAYGLAHSVVANCEEVRRQLVAEGVPERKIVTIYNGLDQTRVEAPDPASREQTLSLLGVPLPPTRQFVTIVANMRSHVKDHPLFLQAAQRVHEAAPQAAFLLAGEGELMPELRAQAAQLGLQDHVCFLGRCQQIAQLLAVTEVGVLSSRSEGFSNAILEYLAAGCPAVVTDVGGAREVITEGETGYIVPVGDASAMADRILALIRAPERRIQMGAQGRNLVRQRFSCEARLRATEELYRFEVKGREEKGREVRSKTE